MKAGWLECSTARLRPSNILSRFRANHWLRMRAGAIAFAARLPCSKRADQPPDHQPPDDGDREVTAETDDPDRKRQGPVRGVPQIFEQRDMQQAGDRQQAGQDRHGKYG